MWTLLKLSLTTWTRGHDVCVVVDYADTDKTTQTLSKTLKASHRFLRNNQEKKRYLGVLSNPIAII